MSLRRSGTCLQKSLKPQNFCVIMCILIQKTILNFFLKKMYAKISQKKEDFWPFKQVKNQKIEGVLPV